MKNYYITFGQAHTTKDGRSLGNSYVKVTAANAAEARKVIFAARGDKWSFLYHKADDAGVNEFDLHEETLEDVEL